MSQDRISLLGKVIFLLERLNEIQVESYDYDDDDGELTESLTGASEIIYSYLSSLKPVTRKAKKGGDKA